MILSKEVEVTIGSNLKYWESKGYTIPKYKDKKRRLSVKKGTRIKVQVSDLPNESAVKILCKCDICGEEKIFEFRELVDKTGKYICRKCIYQTKEYKEKMSKSHIGLTASEETKRKMSENCWMNGKTGNLCPNWNPNLTDEERKNKHYRLNMSGYQRTIKNTKKRDKCCLICGSTKKLHSHHIQDFDSHIDLRCEPDNMVTLCFEHHTAKNGKSIHSLYGKHPTKENWEEFKKLNSI